MEKKKYPIGPEYYELYEEIGQGVSASVSRALCTSLDEVVAIKILDFERDNCNLNNISREAQTMVLIDHPNVLKSHCSFVSDHNLWVVMPFMAGGSALHILKAVFPDGFEEVAIATILREVLKGLEYLHHHGHIHRDVKAGNILIDARGGIKLGDFGVSACLFDSGDRQRTRNTFVGTPCWMAPEVMEPLHGYDFKADIWSFGITALELAHGHAPFSKYPPMKVLLMTLQNAPPGLDYERDRKFSKSFKQMIASCLVKDPSKRPTAKKLLKHHFFKQARSNDYISRTLLEGLPAIGDRIKELKRKEEYMLAQKKMPDGEMEELSQNEYKRGISGWNFNLEDVKAQASLIPDDEPRSEKEQGGSSNSLSALEMQPNQCSAETEDYDPGQNQDTPRALAAYSAIDNIKAKCDKSDDELSISSSIYENNILQINSPPQEGHFENIIGEKYDLEINGRTFDGLAANYQRKGSSLSVAHMPEAFVLPNRGGESNKLQNQAADDAPSEIPSRASKSVGNSDELDEEAKVPVVQQKGRFKVTSENVDLEKVVPSPMLQKSLSLQVGKSEVITQQSAIALQTPSDVSSSNLIGHSLFPMLHSILQTNILQRESILNLMKQVSVGESAARMNDGASATLNTVMTEKSLLEAAHDREKELLHEISELQRRLIRVQEELQKYKTDNSLLNP